MTLPESPLPPWQIVESLADTPVSRTWKVISGETLAVLRVDESGARHLGLNRRAEPGVLRTAAAAGLGPSVLHADADRGQLLTAWLPGRAWSAGDLKDAANLERAAGLLRRLHATPLPAPVVDLHDAINRYAATAGTSFVDEAVAARQHLAGRLAGATEPLCFCHNDPTPGNFIALPGGELKLIDWEYAGLCYPGFDLAGLAVGADLAPAEAKMLLTAYRGRAPTPAESRHHQDWEVVFRAVSGLWQAALASLSG